MLQHLELTSREKEMIKWGIDNVKSVYMPMIVNLELMGKDDELLQLKLDTLDALLVEELFLYDDLGVTDKVMIAKLEKLINMCIGFAAENESAIADFKALQEKINM